MVLPNPGVVPHFLLSNRTRTSESKILIGFSSGEYIGTRDEDCKTRKAGIGHLRFQFFIVAKCLESSIFVQFRVLPTEGFKRFSEITTTGRSIHLESSEVIPPSRSSGIHIDSEKQVSRSHNKKNR